MRTWKQRAESPYLQPTDETKEVLIWHGGSRRRTTQTLVVPLLPCRQGGALVLNPGPLRQQVQQAQLGGTGAGMSCPVSRTDLHLHELFKEGIIRKRIFVSGGHGEALQDLGLMEEFESDC